MAKSTVVLPLGLVSPEENRNSSAEQSIASKRRTPLWLAIVFPKLLLEVLTNHNHDQTVAVIEQLKGRPVIHSATGTAEEQGITVGMALGAAYALCPMLKTCDYDRTAEQRRLEQLAVWAGNFTSSVSLQPPHALLLEVRGSLKLFNGLKKLLSIITTELTRDWRHLHSFSVTPTPIASLMLAQNGQTVLVKHSEQLRSALGSLPIRLLPLNEKKLRQLYNTGVRQLRDLWRLPKDALARRFGPELVKYLDRALSYLLDPRDDFKSPQSFSVHRDWPFEVNDTKLILSIAEELLSELVDFLWQRDACVSHCKFRFDHVKKPSSYAGIGVRIATRDASHLLMLLKEHLNRFTLPAPVTGLTLMADQFQAFSAQNTSLFMLPNDIETSAPGVEDFAKLLEQLQARLGREAIQGLHAVQDHRPECAHRFAELIMLQSVLFKQHRPLWLLPAPQPLTYQSGKLFYQGCITITGGPERIESGWWSGSDIQRDYYVAIDNTGSQLWIYRDLARQGKWYLHGLFA